MSIVTSITPKLEQKQKEEEKAKIDFWNSFDAVVLTMNPLALVHYVEQLLQNPQNHSKNGEIPELRGNSIRFQISGLPSKVQLSDEEFKNLIRQKVVQQLNAALCAIAEEHADIAGMAVQWSESKTEDQQFLYGLFLNVQFAE